jgi:DNA modification methylase
MKPYYEESGVTLYCGNSFEILPALEIDDIEEACIVADPPYGIGKNYGAQSKDDLQTFQAAVALIADSTIRSSVCMSVSRLYDLPRRPQWTGVWYKPISMSGLIAYPIYPHWEPIAFYNFKGNFAGNKGHRSDVYMFNPQKASESGHPTPKPEGLAAELIRFFSPNVVVDPFAGSGTTLVAAKNLGVKAIGIEIEESFCEMTANRLSQAILCFDPMKGRISA